MHSQLPRFLVFTITLSNQVLFWQFLAGVYLRKFPIKACFVFFSKSQGENQLKFQQHNMSAQRVRTTVKLLRRDTSNFIIAPNLWLLNISDFSPVDYRIFAMLEEWVWQHSLRDLDIIIIIIIINKVLIKVTLNKVIAEALYIVICGWNAVKVESWQLTVEWRLKQRCL